MLKKICLLPVTAFASLFCIGQNIKDGLSFKTIDTASFQDAAHHWYDITEKGYVIHPRPGRLRYAATDLTSVADNILLYQKKNGGWPKNYDMMAILSDVQKDSLTAAKDVLNTTFDNRTTYTQIACLAKVYYVTKKEIYKIAAEKGLHYILNAQYENGGWPQYFPLEKNYSRYITFNDDAMAGVMRLLKDILDGKQQFEFIDEDQRVQVTAAFEKGLQCILKTQITDAGKPTAWCQQYDEIKMEPAWARTFEPPSICNGESVDIVLLLMDIKNPGQAVIDAVQNAVAWFNESKITGIRVKTIDAPLLNTKYTTTKTDRIVITDVAAPPIWTRYYELKTHRPLFCNRDGKAVYSLAEVDRERRDGYSWYTYEPQKVLNRYDAWKRKWLKDKSQ